MNRADVGCIGVPHAGNHFMLALIPEARHEHPWPQHPERWMPLLERPLICPMRHPLLIARSWKQRGNKVAGLDLFWHSLVDIVDAKQPHYLCLDRPDLRDNQLQTVNDDLGLDLDAGDWPVLRDHRILAPCELTDEERGYVLQHHYDAFETFFDRWYL